MLGEHLPPLKGTSHNALVVAPVLDQLHKDAHTESWKGGRRKSGIARNKTGMSTVA